MSSEARELTRNPFTGLMRRAMATLAILVVARFVLEVAGVPQDIARFVSSTIGLLFVAIYVAAVGPLRGGLTRFTQLPVPALILAAWTEAWIVVATIIAAVFHLQRSHFAGKEDLAGNWRHLAGHVFGHTVEAGVLFLIVLLLMAVVHVLWRWPVTVAPGAALGVVVIMRFWTEAMGLEPFRTAAWSSTVLVLLSAFYLGGVGGRIGLTEARQLLVPSLVLGWVWRFWVYLATIFAAYVPFFKTHFFDHSRGDIPMRLLRTLGISVVEGFIVGIFVWGIAAWIACATHPGGAIDAARTSRDDSTAAS